LILPNVHLPLERFLLEQDPAEEVDAPAPVEQGDLRARPVQVVAKALHGEGDRLGRVRVVVEQPDQVGVVLLELPEHQRDQLRGSAGRLVDGFRQAMLGDRLDGGQQADHASAQGRVGVPSIPAAAQQNALANQGDALAAGAGRIADRRSGAAAPGGRFLVERKVHLIIHPITAARAPEASHFPIAARRMRGAGRPLARASRPLRPVRARVADRGGGMPSRPGKQAAQGKRPQFRQWPAAS